MNNKASESSTQKKQYSAPALEKGLDILELLADEINGLNISEITHRLGRSLGELFRMLVVLQQRGYVELPQGSDRYRMTIKMFGLANKFPPVKRLNAIATPIMQQLAYSIEQSCHLVIYYEGKGHIVVQQDSPSERIFSVRLGAEAPLVNSCSGHVLLAFSNKENYELMLNRIPSKHPKPVKKELKKRLQHVREQKFECIVSSQAQGVTDIGYPIFDYTGNVVAALVTPFVEYLDDSHAINLTNSQVEIQSAAQQISSSLGYGDDSNLANS